MMEHGTILKSSLNSLFNFALLLYKFGINKFN